MRLTHNLIEGGSAGLRNIPTANVEETITASSLADIFLSTTPGSSVYLRLKAGSPAIDAGTNDWIDGEADTYETGDQTDVTDLAGNARLVGTQVDLGTYEYDATLPLLDVTTTPAVTTGLPASGGTITAAIGLSGAATGWSATTNDPFITLSPASSTADGTLTIRYTPNNSGSTRSGSVTIASTGGMGNAFTHTLTLTQTTILRVAATLPEGSDESGGSWANAMALHAALLAFHAGDTIWLQAGSYTPVYRADGNSPRDARDAVFSVPAGAVLYGGFAGMETSLAERNLSTANTTLITGEIGASSNTDNIKRLIVVSAWAEVILDGLTLADAYGSSSGAGVYVSANAVLRIHNCLFRNNTGYNAGAVYGDVRSTLTITGSTFTGNSASGVGFVGHGHGGAVYGSSQSTLIITGSTFTRNSANSAGGAVYGDNNSTLTITGSTFTGNSTSGRSADHGGGAVYGSSRSTLTITGSTFTGNSATVSGGAVYESDGGGYYGADNSTLGTVPNCVSV